MIFLKGGLKVAFYLFFKYNSYTINALYFQNLNISRAFGDHFASIVDVTV